MKRGMPGIASDAKASSPFSPGHKQLTVKAQATPTVIGYAKSSPTSIVPSGKH